MNIVICPNESVFLNQSIRIAYTIDTKKNYYVNSFLKFDSTSELTAISYLAHYDEWIIK